jgi:energy-dependent translational throttle protein EttA
MAEFVFQIHDLEKATPQGRKILKDINLSFFPGAKIGVLGLNGSGKSTLLKIMAGVDTEYTGTARPMEGIRIGYLQQEPKLDPNKTVKENIEEGVADSRAVMEEFDAVNMKFAEEMTDDEMNALIERQGELQDIIDHKNLWELDREVGVAMDALRVPPDDADVTKISGGERRRVALCRLLLSKPDMLLLDEPTNHLDAESVAWLERFLHEFPGTVVAVTHDRYFLDNVAGWILELDRGAGIPWKGNYTSWLDQKTKRLEQESKEKGRRQKHLEKELEWVRGSQKAKQKKGKARLRRYEDLLAQDSMDGYEAGTIKIPGGPRLGTTVIEAKNVSKSFGDRLLFEGLSFNLPPAAKLGIIGPNGAGKTTLFRIITGLEQPTSGEVKLGSTVKIAYVDQSRDDLLADKTVYDLISGGYERIVLGDREFSSRAYLTWFNLRGDMQQKKVGILSGGERNRVHMAMLLKEGGNVLLLDEPTNDLDVDTLRTLEEAIANFAGCAVIISHDRWFLDRVATHILAYEGDSKVVFCEGNYSDYEEDRKKRLGDEGPHRIRYRSISGSR